MLLIFPFRFFESLLAGKWAPLMVWDLQTQPKSWPTGWTFCANRYLEIMFSKFSGAKGDKKGSETPPMNTLKGFKHSIARIKQMFHQKFCDSSHNGLGVSALL